MAEKIVKKRLPVPPCGSGRPKGESSVFAGKLIRLEVGECLISEEPKRRPVWSSAGTYWGKKLGRKFVTRRIDEGSFGIWRVA